MSARNNTESETPVESISVSLKPVLGLSPRLYVPILWLFLIGLAVFFLLILPGLRRNGTWLTVDTLPPGCEVIFNGQRLGPSGKPVWAPKGEGILEVRKPGFSSFSEETTVPGRVFASRLFPSKRYMQVILTVNDHFSPQAAGLNSFAGWAGTGPENGRYALPPSLTQAAADLASLEGALEGGASDNAAAPKAAAAEGKKPPLTWAPAALPFSLDQRHLADILRAEIITGGGGAPAGAAQLPELIAAAAVFLDNNPQYASALTLLSGQQPGKTGSSTPEETEADMFSAKAAAEKEAVNRRTEKLIAAFPALWQAKRTAGPAGRRLLGGIYFTGIPSGTAILGDVEVVQAGYNARSGALPRSVDYTEFSIADQEVSNAAFAAFAAAVPKWAPSGKDTLVKAGLADSGYLKHWENGQPKSGNENEPVRNISWYAANAYAQWFTEQFAPPGWTAVLPSENQWETAARFAGIAANTEDIPHEMLNTSQAESASAGIRGMAGNVREWCSSVYAFNAPLFSGLPRQNDFSDNSPVERAVRGGAFIDSRLAYPAAVRGGLPPEVCSPVIGFRLALEK